MVELCNGIEKIRFDENQQLITEEMDCAYPLRAVFGVPGDELEVTKAEFESRLAALTKGQTRSVDDLKSLNRIAVQWIRKEAAWGEPLVKYLENPSLDPKFYKAALIWLGHQYYAKQQGVKIIPHFQSYSSWLPGEENIAGATYLEIYEPLHGERPQKHVVMAPGSTMPHFANIQAVIKMAQMVY